MPTEMPMSATLKMGHQPRSRKSTTDPKRTRSTRLPMVPPRIMAQAAVVQAPHPERRGRAQNMPSVTTAPVARKTGPPWGKSPKAPPELWM